MFKLTLHISFYKTQISQLKMSRCLDLQENHYLQKWQITQMAIAQTPAKKYFDISSKIGQKLTPSCQFMAQNSKNSSDENLSNVLTSQK